MKPSIRTMPLIAAICMSLFTCYYLIEMIVGFFLTDVFVRYFKQLYGCSFFLFFYFFLLLGSIVMALITMSRQNFVDYPSKSFRIMTYILTFVSLVFFITKIYHPSIVFSSITLVSASIWTWMLYFQCGIGNISKSLRIAMKIGICVLIIPLILWIINSVIPFTTWRIMTTSFNKLCLLVIFLVSNIILCWYSIELIKHNSDKING